jgi:multiple sugar transport system permease protein
VNIATLDKILDPSIQRLYVSAGIVLLMLPMVILYLLLQKKFVESVERSGIVG